MVLDLGRIKHRADIMHKSVGSNGIAIPSNARLSADGQKNVIWTPFDPGSAVTSFGSNATDITTATAAGASANAAREDHRHRGVRSITANGSNTLFGNVDLQAGTGIAIGVTGQVITLSNIAAGASGGGGGSGPTDYVSGASGTGQIIIPGLAGSSDIRVAATNDDEFDTTDTSDPMTGWTTLGTPTAHDINSTVKGHYYIKKSAAAGVGWHGIYKAVPGLPDTIITKIAALNGKNQFNTAAIFFGESPPGKMETIGIRFSANQQCRVEHDSWTGPTGTGAAITTGADMYPYAGPLWVKLVLTSSSSISVYLSTNGLLWLPFTIARNPGFTIGVAGLVVDCENASDDVEGLFDWIRYT